MARVELSRDRDVFVLRMCAGENRVNAELLSELGAALDQVEASSGPAALVTTGEGRFYSNGLDLEGLRQGGSDSAQRVLSGLHQLFARLLAFPMITVAAINGHAFAGGAMIALAHDFRVMRADRGFFCLPEVDLRTGQPLSDAMVALLGARLAPQVLHEALVTGRRYGGSEARARDIVDQALPESELLEAAVARAQALAGKHRETLVALKRGVYSGVLERIAAPLDASTGER